MPEPRRAMLMRFLWLSMALAACSSLPSPGARLASADQLAAAQGWRALDIVASPFVLRAYVPPLPAITSDRVLTIYFEGDGMAWISPSDPSLDPTPIDAIGLKLALRQPEGLAVYLARPCQYTGGSDGVGCGQRYWTSARFAPEVIDASNRAVDQLKKMFSARQIVLVGYSGGAAVAALVASRRNDVEKLVTVAGNLDHRGWTSYHHVDPLSGSLNPADFRAGLTHLRQWHFVGERDEIIPPALTNDFSRAMSAAHVQVVPGFDHHCCWVASWPALWQQAQ